MLLVPRAARDVATLHARERFLFLPALLSLSLDSSHRSGIGTMSSIAIFVSIGFKRHRHLAWVDRSITPRFFPARLAEDNDLASSDVLVVSSCFSEIKLRVQLYQSTLGKRWAEAVRRTNRISQISASPSSIKTRKVIHQEETIPPPNRQPQKSIEKTRKRRSIKESD